MCGMKMCVFALVVPGLEYISQAFQQQTLFPSYSRSECPLFVCVCVCTLSFSRLMSPIRDADPFLKHGRRAARNEEVKKSVREFKRVGVWGGGGGGG